MTTPIHPAATVVVLRDTPGGLEVFLVRRHQAIAFMAGAHVFPGGRVDDGDHEADGDWCDGVAGAQHNMPGVDLKEALAFQVAAARELFEEAGVLVARTARGEFVALTADADRERFASHRADLNASRRSFHDIIAGERLRLALDALVPFAHWVTPPIDIKRFDTRFFATRVPPHQTPSHDAHEATESLWIAPRLAIAAATRDELLLPPPTWATLRELERFDSVEAALTWAATHRIERREPIVTLENGVRKIVLPGDPTMPEREPVAYETRFVMADGRWRPEPAE